MALASCQEARSPVELSLSPVYQYQFSSLFKALDVLGVDQQERYPLQQRIQRNCMSYFDHSSADYYLLQTDTTPLCKPHSPTLKGRTCVSIPNNMIAGNRPLGIGYELSCINLSDPPSNWSLPLSFKRVALEETAGECALQQLNDLISHPDLPFSKKQVINTADSKYGNARFLAPAHQHPNLINITRLRAGVKVWKQYDGPPQKGHAKKIFGEKYYLHKVSQLKTYRHPRTGKPTEVFQRSIFELPADEHQRLHSQTRKGRKITIELWRFNNMMIRSKDGHNMKDKPFDLLTIKVTDAHTAKVIFDREMYVAICGQHKHNVSTDQAFGQYRHRYDIEPYLRFAKQRLLLQHYQTPDTHHLDSWLLILQMASWLLYAASDETHLRLRKWEKYLPENKSAAQAKRLSMAQTRKSLQDLFLTFDLAPFKPLKCKKGKGRAKGTTFQPRKRYKWVKKVAHKRNSKTYCEQLE